MSPEEDPTWPVCVDHGTKHWCSNVAAYMKNNRDGEKIEWGIRFCVPIVPSLNIYAECTLGEAIVPDLCYDLFLVTPSEDPFDPDAEGMDRIGMWTKGEGRVVIDATLKAHVEAALSDDFKCNYSAHGFNEELNFQREVNHGGVTRWVNQWSIYSYKMCRPCQNKQNASGQAASSPSMDPDNYGLNIVTAPSGRSAGKTAAQERTRQALEQRRAGRA